MKRGRRWIAERQERLHPTLDFDGHAGGKASHAHHANNASKGLENRKSQGLQPPLYDILHSQQVEDLPLKRIN